MADITDLLKYYSDINCDQIVLVHGDMKTKIQFAKKLQDEIGKKNKTQKNYHEISKKFFDFSWKNI